MMYLENNNRPSTEPYGTPENMGSVSDLCSLNSTPYFLLLKKLYQQRVTS